MCMEVLDGLIIVFIRYYVVHEWPVMDFSSSVSDKFCWPLMTSDFISEFQCVTKGF